MLCSVAVVKALMCKRFWNAHNQTCSYLLLHCYLSSSPEGMGEGNSVLLSVWRHWFLERELKFILDLQTLVQHLHHLLHIQNIGKFTLSAWKRLHHVPPLKALMVPAGKVKGDSPLEVSVLPYWDFMFLEIQLGGTSQICSTISVFQVRTENEKTWNFPKALQQKFPHWVFCSPSLWTIAPRHLQPLRSLLLECLARRGFTRAFASIPSPSSQFQVFQIHEESLVSRSGYHVNKGAVREAASLSIRFVVPKVRNEMCIILELLFLFFTLYDQILKDTQYKSQCLKFYQYLP